MAARNGQASPSVPAVRDFRPAGVSITCEAAGSRDGQSRRQRMPFPDIGGLPSALNRRMRGGGSERKSVSVSADPPHVGAHLSASTPASRRSRRPPARAETFPYRDPYVAMPLGIM